MADKSKGLFTYPGFHEAGKLPKIKARRPGSPPVTALFLSLFVNFANMQLYLMYDTETVTNNCDFKELLKDLSPE
jgi:hypothetical protein